MQALVVEDDSDMALLIRQLLEQEGFVVEVSRTAEEGLALAFINSYDALVLDLGLPDRNGLAVVQDLRLRGNATPVLVLTGAKDKETIVRALDAGADDYVTKPVVPDEFRARVRALIRRGGAKRTETLSCANVVLNRLTRRVLIDGSELSLTPKEFALLEHFLLHIGSAITRTTLLEKVWDLNVDRGSNVVDVGVARLRKKLEEAQARVTISGRRGMGFELNAVKAP
jgi:DNA-binding response OmpR family regulator